MKKKGQIGLGDAPNVVMIVGLVFLLMATIAYVSYQYGTALLAVGTSATAINETLATNSTGKYLSAYNRVAGNCGSLVYALNESNNVYPTLTGESYFVSNPILRVFPLRIVYRCLSRHQLLSNK